MVELHVYATESQVYITGNATLSHNTAEKNGGAILLYQSHLECQDNGKPLLLENIAGEREGAIHAISSSIRIIFISVIQSSCIFSLKTMPSKVVQSHLKSMQSCISSLN